ncbi:hypothetical protein FHS23_004464 [Prauserella isguenensis]|uniref:Uncharacterized protein n=1 Tax=Prauserella isguenensis TaxID=1470180 RepID=A0A839S6C4_9PSEU|nr:hypothetical protein [Prauserella isguenensis]MBB3053415.1 hypothetical protein [Prauserella isguenensis]
MTTGAGRRAGRKDLPQAPSRYLTSDHPNTETSAMLLHEELTRDRIRELRKQAEGGGAERRRRAARRWQRVARWASRRAAHFDR